MSCSKSARLMIDAGIDYKLPVPYVISGDGIDKSATVFLMADRDKGLSVIGTFDEILEFASSIIASMYTWPISMGRNEWLGEPVEPGTEERELYVIRRASQDTGNQARHCGDKGTGETGDSA